MKEIIFWCKIILYIDVEHTKSNGEGKVLLFIHIWGLNSQKLHLEFWNMAHHLKNHHEHLLNYTLWIRNKHW